MPDSPTPGAAPRDEARERERNLKYLWRAFLRKLGVVNPESAAVLAHEDAADLFATFATEWLAAAPRADRNEPSDQAIEAAAETAGRFSGFASLRNKTTWPNEKARAAVMLRAAYAVDFPAAARAPGGAE